MKLCIFSDTHLNVSRQAHTTAESSKKLNDRLYEQATNCLSMAHDNVIVGDLFDKTFNPEWAIIQGIRIAKQAFVLAGNHDETNREGTKCSLEVVHASGGQVIRQLRMGYPHVKVIGDLVFVPHHATQELFDQALEEAVKMSKELRGNRYLFVHCNRGEAIGDKSDSTLYISDEQEDKLLGYFQRVFYGHEHKAATHKGGKVVVCGNTFPTSFGDIGTKYRYFLDTDTDVMTSQIIWDVDTHYVEVTIGETLPVAKEAEFVLIKGSATRKETAEMIEQCWKAYPQALAVRSIVSYPDEVVTKAKASEPVNLLSAIESDLEGSEMLELFLELKHAAD